MDTHYRALCALMLAGLAMTAHTLSFADEPVAEPGQLDFPGSLGERSGLLAGDVLMKLNDKPGEEYDMAALGAFFRGTEPLKIEVERDGQMQIIHEKGKI